MRISSTWDASESSEAEALEGADASLRQVEQATDRVLESRALGVALTYALGLQAHKYGVDNRPSSPLKWDRKAWSHLHLFRELGVPLAPGNVVLACCTQAVMCRGGTVVGSKGTRLCENCVWHRGDLHQHGGAVFHGWCLIVM